MRRASINWLKSKSSRKTEKLQTASKSKLDSFPGFLRALSTGSRLINRRRRKQPTNPLLPLLPLRPNGIPREMTDKDGSLLWYGEYTAWGRLKKDERVYKNAHPKRTLYKNRFIFFLLLRILVPLKLELSTSLMTYLILIKST